MQLTYPNYFHGPTHSELAATQLKNAWLRPSAVADAWVNWQVAQISPNLRPGLYGSWRRGMDVVMAAALVDGQGLPTVESDMVPAISKQLAGKRILVVGDDIGSFSQILKRDFKVRSCGIEVDPIKVRLAHQGRLSDSSEPRNQVLQGSAWELADRRSALAERVGSFRYDMIFSYNLFAYGSGIERDIGINKMPAIMHEWLQSTSWLLKRGGLQLHRQVSLGYAPFASERGYSEAQYFITNDSGLKNIENLAVRKNR